MAPRSMPAESSAIPPLPYFPNLRRALASHGAALMLVYLELYCPAPQDSPDGPVLVDMERLRLDLCLNRWLAGRYFSFIGVRHVSEAARRAAAVAGREFLRLDHRMAAGQIKCYSLTPAGPGMHTLRRNYPRLRSLLSTTGCVAQLAAWPRVRPAGQFPIEAAFEDNSSIEANRAFSVSRVDFSAAISRRPEVVAAEVARSLNRISGFGDRRRIVKATDGRRRKGIKRKPWTPERRAKYEATMARKRSGGAQPGMDGEEANDVW